MALASYDKGDMEKAVEYYTKLYCFYTNVKDQNEDADYFKRNLQSIYEESGYGKENPDFDKWMQGKIQQYGQIFK